MVFNSINSLFYWIAMSVDIMLIFHLVLEFNPFLILLYPTFAPIPPLLPYTLSMLFLEKKYLLVYLSTYQVLTFQFAVKYGAEN